MLSFKYEALATFMSVYVLSTLWYVVKGFINVFSFISNLKK